MSVRVPLAKIENEQSRASTSNNNKAASMKELAKLNGPSTFGGIALLYGTPRTAEVILF